jgi:hypothetical protein
MAAHAAGLSDAELRHFGQNGWVLKQVFTVDECATLRSAGDAELEARAAEQGHTAADVLQAAGKAVLSFHGIIDTRPSEEKPEGPAVAVAASVFKRVWQEHPVIQGALTQLLGTGPPVFTDSSVRMTPPHPDRHDPAAQATSRDPSAMAWHRGIRPSWGVRNGAADDHIVSSWVNTATYLSDVLHADDGGTRLLSGSHLINDADLPVSTATPGQAVGPMGSVLFFSEAMIHCAVDVLSDSTRYAMFIACAPSGIETRVGWRPAEESDVEWDQDLAERRQAVAEFGVRMCGAAAARL